jgi:CDP-diacylglycerol---serine O-phosphatidyltransferase
VKPLPITAGDRPLRKRHRGLALLPTMFTLGNAVCGMAAIAVLMSDAPRWTPDGQLFSVDRQLFASDGQLFFAGLLVFGGMLFDMLDGRAARMTGQTSEFGAQLDSLCDAITFGVVPAVILWQFAAVYPERVRWVFGVLFTLCVIIRLARFNVETKEDSSHDEFFGLPSPAAAGTIASFATAVPQLSRFASPDTNSVEVQELATNALLWARYGLPVLAVVLSYLMISRFRYPHVFQQWFAGQRSLYQIGQIVFGAFFIYVAREIAVPMVFCYFAFESPLRQITRGRVEALRRSREERRISARP